jgi:uncharacterized protein (DUF2147 family)
MVLSKLWNVVLVLICCVSLKCQAQVVYKADDLVGEWFVEDKTAVIKIFTDGSKFYGLTLWLKEPRDDKGKMKVDSHNPDASMHSKHLLGALICKNFSFAGDGVWNNGTIYDSRTGKTYNCKITMKDINTIHLRGFIGISLIGGTTVWTRKK